MVNFRSFFMDTMKIIQIAGIVMFINGLFLQLIGYHNIDLSFNSKFLDLKDIGLSGRIQTIEEGYLKGLRFLFLGMVCYLLSFIFLLVGGNDGKAL